MTKQKRRIERASARVQNYVGPDELIAERREAARREAPTGPTKAASPREKH